MPSLLVLTPDHADLSSTMFQLIILLLLSTDIPLMSDLLKHKRLGFVAEGFLSCVICTVVHLINEKGSPDC